MKIKINLSEKRTQKVLDLIEELEKEEKLCEWFWDNQ